MNTKKDLRWVVAAVSFGICGPAFAQEAGTPPETAPAEPAPPTEPAPPAQPTPETATPETAPPATATPAIPRLTAQLPPPPPPSDDLPIPTLTIDRIPPNTSFEFAVQASFGQVAYFRDQLDSWVGFGLRGGWGKNLGVHRFGLAGTLSAEGDIGVHTQIAAEPAFAWDFVSGNGILLGASVGPAVVWTADSSTIHTDYQFDLAPSAAARIGWSQTWSRVGRRLFLFVEPKARVADGRVSSVVAVAVGSGGGR